MSTGPDDGYPQWSARGDRLLFVHQTPSGAELWEVARDGTDAHRVAAGLPAIGQLPSVPFGSSGLASYRGIFAWNGAAMLP